MLKQFVEIVLFTTEKIDNWPHISLFMMDKTGLFKLKQHLLSRTFPMVHKKMNKMIYPRPKQNTNYSLQADKYIHYKIQSSGLFKILPCSAIAFKYNDKLNKIIVYKKEKWEI